MSAIARFFVRYPFVATTLVIIAVSLGLWLGDLRSAAQIVATVYVVLFVLWTSVDMVRDIMRGNFGLDILAVVAMVATIAVGEYFAALTVVLMLSGGEALEDYAANRARHELSSLVNRTPQTAQLVAEGKDTSLEEVPVEEVPVGASIVVRPGEVVPLDGTLVSPEGTFDESSITGESLPQHRGKGEEVLSGAVNGNTAVTLKTTRLAGDSQYQQIVKLVQEAEESKAPAVRVADRFAVPFTALALIIAGAAWAISGQPVRFAEVLVLATPCPLLIAAPVAFMGGMSRAAKNGIILKGGAVLETLARIESAGFDKTGTITLGRPEVVHIERRGKWAQDPDGAEKLLQLAASAEQYSSHVLADAILRAARDKSLPLMEAQEAHEVAGAGIEATIGDHVVVVGNETLLRKSAKVDFVALAVEGQAVAHVMVDGHYAGALVLADEIRPNSPGVIQWLKDNGVTTVAMLTGDHSSAVEKIAAQAGVTEIHAGLKPQEKVERVAELSPKPSLMVGDGVNDAPALAAANVGLAMGARGATAAGEAADGVIMADEISKVADAVAISKQTLRVGLTAIWLGIILSVGLMLIATTGAIPALAGALTQEFVDLAAILYALRALTGKLPELPTVSAPVGAKTPVR